MQTPDLAEANFRKLAALFPNAVTETVNDAGEVVRAIDADVLRQEISAAVVEGPQERYQFTWPDKKKSVVLANAPIRKTLRLDRSRSVGRDGTRGGIDTENIYIEGDNLDALKLLQETYLGKVKMIYIDPPYNTGSDFIYEDDFSQAAAEYLAGSGQFDEEGNRLVQNTESNGRFHTDWLNMLYPRLRIAKDFLSDDGVIFISIDDNEQENLKKICDEIFGTGNFVGTVVWQHSIQPKGYLGTFSMQHSYVMIYCKSFTHFKLGSLERTETDNKSYSNPDNDPNGPWRSGDVRNALYRPNLIYDIISPSGKVIKPCPNGWRWSKETVAEKIKTGEIIFSEDETRIIRKIYLKNLEGRAPETLWFGKDVGTTREGVAELKRLFERTPFDTPKPTKLISRCATLVNDPEIIILDFFSGSATTAHAVMQLNAEDGGNRKFILVQLPERCGEKSEARKAGYETICDIGEERIRRAGDKIREETGAAIDYGFRVFRVDSTNMEDVYYKPADYRQDQLDLLAGNIKPDRTPEDLLFQVMLDLGILLSSPIEETVIAGKKVFSAAEGYLLACFDSDVTEETVTEIAKRQPFYAVFRDSSMATDSVAANFEQIFQTYSPKTVRKVL
ncbi:MAG: site-specific DNA-methyltransferase [Oscillibacter sp.]|nr:site-specific DNA-methyltransferase [Oscillibacter sp.]